jgi:hypothetical protein
MKRVFRLSLCLAFAFLSPAYGAENPYDGDWDTIVSCGNRDDAMGYSFSFSSHVENGTLEGHKGEEGKPGWYRLKGKIAPEGVAKLYASGRVGAAQYTVGHIPKGSEYAYHVEAKFSGHEGSGHRVEGRACDVTFSRQ